MSPSLTVVVAAVPALVEAMRATGQFANVLSVSSTSGLRDLLASGTLSRAANDKVFIFADSTPVDTTQSLPFLIKALASMGTPVLIIATSPGGKDLARQCAGAGLLEGPITLNQVMGALAGHPKLPNLTPVSAEQNVHIALPGLDEPTPAPAASPFAAAPVSTPAPAPAVPSFGGAPTSAPAPAFGAPAARAQVPGGEGFGSQSAAPVAIPVPEQATPLSPFGASPFGAAAAAPASPDPIPAPFGAGAPQGAPAFGQSAAPASPFGGSAQTPLNPSPFSQSAVEPAASPFGGGGAPAAPAFGGASDTSPFSSTPSAAPVSFDKPAMAPSPFGGGGTDAPAFGQGAQVSPFGGGQQSAPAGSAFGAPMAVQQAPQGFGGGPVARADVAVSERPQRRGHVITIAAPKGGTGKSTMTLNLAAYLGLRLRGTGRNVCIIDANVQQADTGKYLNTWTPNIEGVLRDTSSIHPDRIGEHLVHLPQLNMSALLGPTNPEAANPLYYTGKRYAQILEALKPNFDYIFIDTPVAELYHDMFRDFALPCADFIAVVATPNSTTLMNADSWLRQVTAPVNANGMGINPDKIGVVLNRAEDDIGIDEDEVRRELGQWRFLTGVPETKEWKRCNNEGTLVATKNYHELNEAFSIILQAATGEDLVTAGSGLPPAKPSKGLRRWLGKGKS